MSLSPSYWVSTNRGHHRWRPGAARVLMRGLQSLTGRRIHCESWIRYQAVLSEVPEAPAHVHLEQVTDATIERLKQHPDSTHNQVVSGFRFWELGLRRAYIWMADDTPICIQWLLLAQDHELIARLPSWSGMYPPLEAGCGQVENLFRFSTAGDRRNVAVDFELAMYAVARRLGLSQLLTHIHADNAAANRFALRAAFQPAGRIYRYGFQLPLLRQNPVYVHEVTAPLAAPSAVAVPTPA